MLSRIIDFVKNNIKVVILVGAIIFMIIVINIISAIRNNINNNSPITSVECYCTASFYPQNYLSDFLQFFEVYATRENGSKTKMEINSDNFRLSEEYIKPYGEETEVEVTFTYGDKEYSCNVIIPHVREKLVGFQCGYPNAADVVAVLYSNGELRYEGEGDVLVWYEGDYPWLNDWWTPLGMDKENIVEINSVTFDEGVMPTSLNYAFEGCTSLSYIDKIPSSVKTMVRTFANCTNLTVAADVSNATNLLNMTGTYEGCSSLTDANMIPGKVKVANSTFRNCTELQVSADMSKADELVNIDRMYENCMKLSVVTLSDNITSMACAFSECINLKQVDGFPSKVKNMGYAFNGDVSFARFDYTIPKTVKNLEGCFANCEVLSGEITIDCNANSFNDMFTGACQVTKVNLIGKSKLLDAYANTTSTDNVYVNGKRRNEQIVSYSDVFGK